MRFRLRLPLAFKDPALEREYVGHYLDGNRRSATVSGIMACVLILGFWVANALAGAPEAVVKLSLRNVAIAVPWILAIVFVNNRPDPWRRFGPMLMAMVFAFFAYFLVSVADLAHSLGIFRPERLGIVCIFAIGSYSVVSERAYVVSGSVLLFSSVATWLVATRPYVELESLRLFVVQMVIANVVGVIMTARNEANRRRIYLLQRNMQFEKDRSDALVLGLIPEAAAGRLKAAGEGFADTYPDATVLFADLVGFSKYAATQHPQELVRVLSKLFGAFDAVVKETGGERIKTIGDAYMVVVGCPTPIADHAQVALRLAEGMLAATRQVFRDERVKLDIRVGIHSGVLVGGVLSYAKPAFDVWGDTVNIAARLESAATPGTVLVSESTWEQTRTAFAFGDKVPRDLKGVGRVSTFELRQTREAA